MLKYQQKQLYANEIDIFSFIYLTTILLPIVERVFSTYLLVGIVFLLNILLFFRYSSYFNKKALLAISLLLVLEFVESISEGGNLIIRIYDFARTSALLLMGIHYSEEANIKRGRTLFYLSICMLSITAVTSCRVLVQNAEAARKLATVSDSQSAFAIEMSMKNVGGFNLVYLSVLFVPLLIWLVTLCKTLGSQKSYIKPFLGLSAILLMVFVMYASYTTAIITMLLTVVLVLMVTRTKQKNVMLFFIVIFALILYLLRYQLADFMTMIGNNMGGAVANRMSYLADAINGVENSSDAQLRITYYERAWQTFLRHPIIGGLPVGDLQISGHSMILDVLAKYGFIGAFLLVGYYKGIYTYFFKKYASEPAHKILIMTIFLLCVLLSILNPVNNRLFMFFLYPLGLSIFVPATRNVKRTGISL